MGQEKHYSQLSFTNISKKKNIDKKLKQFLGLGIVTLQHKPGVTFLTLIAQSASHVGRATRTTQMGALNDKKVDIVSHVDRKCKGSIPHTVGFCTSRS